MASINLGVVGCANQRLFSVAPSFVSVGTSASGNYDDALGTHAYKGGNLHNIHNQAGSVFSSNSGETQLDITELSSYSANNDIAIQISAYLRAAGATSYSWTLSDLTDSGGVLGFVPSLNTSSMSTAQDSTFGNSSHLGGYVVISAGGGRGGLTWGDAGDWIQFKVQGTATNGIGSTNSDEITCKIVWTAGDSGD